MHLSSGHAGMSAGTWKLLFRYHGQVCTTLKMTKSSGCTSLKSDLYAMPSAQPAASSMLLAWIAVVGWPGQAKLELRSRMSPLNKNEMRGTSWVNVNVPLGCCEVVSVALVARDLEVG